MRHPAWRLPEISGGNRVLDTVLDSYATALEQYAPLFLRVAVYLTGSVRGDPHHREHDVFAGEDPRFQAFGEGASDALGLVIKIEEMIHPHLVLLLKRLLAICDLT